MRSKKINKNPDVRTMISYGQRAFKDSATLLENMHNLINHGDMLKESGSPYTEIIENLRPSFKTLQKSFVSDGDAKGKCRYEKSIRSVMFTDVLSFLDFALNAAAKIEEEAEVKVKVKKSTKRGSLKEVVTKPSDDSILVQVPMDKSLN